jgi:phenylalanyl-tRNA synthetase beta chain
VVRRAKEGEKMNTLDGVERVFTHDDLLICDGEGPVAVAGVMGGENSEIASDTRDVLVECAYFDPRSVRRTGRRLGLHTDASHRFERGVDPNAVPRVLARTTQLIADLSGGEVAKSFVDAYPKAIDPKRIRFDMGRARRLLGFDVDKLRARAILGGLGCSVHESGDESFDVTLPTFRPDLGREVDLDEEVARVLGYDLVPTEVPPVRPSAKGSPPMVRFDRALRESAASAGLIETIGYAFVSPTELEAASVSKDAVPLQNPLSEERSVMRTSLLPSLAAAARRSQRHQVGRIQLFELGRTYHPTDDAEPLPREERVLGLLLLGNREAWIGEGDSFDFYDGKGVVEEILRPVLGVAGQYGLDDALDSKAPWLHPRRRALIEIHGAKVGSVGELHPDVSETLDLEGRAVYAELSVTALLQAEQRLGVPQARPLPRYPAVARDIAIIVDEEHSAKAIAEQLSVATDGLAEAVRLFDLYRGDQIPAGKKSMAFRLVYRDPESTLTDKRVDKVHEKAKKAAERRFGAVIR